MSASRVPGPPKLDERRASDFLDELLERARLWIPDWELDDDSPDFGRALLKVAARLNSEVAERLDGVGEKMRRGFLDWLAVCGEAARPARMPVAFKLSDAAPEAVFAKSPIKMQADANGTPVIFETEADIHILPGQLDVVVGVDIDRDAYYLPPPGLNDLSPIEPGPAFWTLKSFAANGSTKLQLDPDAGLKPGMLIDAGGQQYRVVKVENGIVTIEPGLDADLAESATVRKVVSFVPFGNVARNQQEHALYLGHMDLLNIEAAATIDVVGAVARATGVTWQYWGKVDGSDKTGWQTLTVTPQETSSTVVLKKVKGAIEPYQIGATNSRWIRAFTNIVEGSAPALQVDSLEIRINCKPEPPPCPVGTADVEPSPATEAMANTTPLVLDNVFFPLGKEPRQFDAFYLGCQEAFSKKMARVQVCFKMAEPSFAALSSLRVGPLAGRFLAGAAADGCLHLLRFDPATKDVSRIPNRDLLRPPSPGPSGGLIDRPSVTLDQTPTFRAPVWTVGTNIFVAVTAKNTVWIWREDTRTSSNSGWQPSGLVGGNEVSDASASIVDLVYLSDGSMGRLFALRGSTLFVRDLNDQNVTWHQVQTKTSGGAPVQLSRIAPIRIEGVDLGGGMLNEGLVGIGTNEKLYGINGLERVTLEGTCFELLNDVASDMGPAAVRSARLGNQLIAVAVSKAQPGRKFLASLSSGPDFHHEDDDEADLGGSEIIGHSIDVNLMGGHLHFAACVKKDSNEGILALWAPFDPDPHAVLLSRNISAHGYSPVGAPTLLPNHVLVPTTSSQVIVATFDLPRFSTPLLSALITSSSPATGDKVAIPVARRWPTHELADVGAGTTKAGQTLFEFNFQSIDRDVFVYPSASPEFSATIDDSNQLNKVTLDAAHHTSARRKILLITTDLLTPALYKVRSVSSGVATLDRDLEVFDPQIPPPTVSYKVPESTVARLRPLLHLDPATTGNWDAALLQTPLIFPGAEPERVDGIAFTVDLATGHPELVVLADHWSVAPPDIGAGNVEFLLDISLDDWVAHLGDTLTNPELSWEYWNGKGWWKLRILLDETQNLKTSGAFRFEVPDDIAASDWAGKENFWIRARLVGGDYGRETVTVKIKPLGGGVTEQTVKRSSEGIRAPSVVNLHISYSLCDGVRPTYVLAQDSGTIRDQSDANYTAGAIVEAFVPLAVMLRRLSAGGGARESFEDCPSECDFPTQQATAAATPAPADSTALATGRSLFIGLAATPSEAPINVLMLVEERNHTKSAPLKIEALVADRFVPVVAEDATRALGESGILSMSLDVPPTPSELFGHTRTWLRLTPKPDSAADWSPVLRGAYLNAVWASATESLTRELLGSSGGQPNLTVKLARPPVLRNSLELRIREPLGEEQQRDLTERDKKRVLSNVEGLPGDWVLWKQVTDPGDEPANARVYALDEATGEIRFGDGLHGAIPPIGRDSIVAFKYGRTEASKDRSPGNSIVARTAMNLVSPVETVESVIAADHAAGGAPPESDDRVLRFGFARLRHRNRVVTTRDIEDLALQSSPDIAQARAIQRGRSTRLVIVMQGKNPSPTAVQVRELQRLILQAGPISLSEPGALQIVGPRLRRLRVQLELRVESLDHAGELGKQVKVRLVQFFDTALGGPYGDGWRLGESPSEDDIAFALVKTSNIQTILDVKLHEVVGDGELRDWRPDISDSDLVRLDDDPVRIRFETAEVAV